MIYLDSCLVIYFVERHPTFYKSLDKLLIQNAQEGFAISPLVKMECLVKPLKVSNKTLQEDFQKFFKGLVLLSMSEGIFTAAAHKRAFSKLKTPDALHLATAEYHGCSAFWTNDNRLEKASPLAKNVL